MGLDSKMTAPTLPDISVTGYRKPAAPQRGPALLDRIFGGGVPTPQNPYDSHRAGSDALVSAGLTLASHRGPGGLLAALEAGKKSYGESVAGARLAEQERIQQETRQLYQEALLNSANDPDSLLSLSRQVMALGDTEGAKAILDMAKLEASFKENKRTQVVQNPKTGEAQLIDLDTGAKLATIFSPIQGEDPGEYAGRVNQVLSQYRQALQPTGYDGEDQKYIQQLEDALPLASRADNPSSEAQETFFRALFRLQNPGLRRVSDDAVFAQADQLGLLNGKIAEDIQNLTQGNLPAEAIERWMPTVRSIIQGRIKQFDDLRNHYRSLARDQFQVNPDVIYDYFAPYRAGSMPGVSRETMDRFDKEIENQKAKRKVRP